MKAEKTMANNPKNSSDTKQLVEVASIHEDLVLLKNGSLRMLIEVGALNFELKSTDEQTAIIKGFQDFLNSIDFPLQIVIHSRRLSIKKYLTDLSGMVEKLDNELLKIQGQEYIKFVSGLTDLGNIMSKKFYIVVPYYALALGDVKKGIFSTFKGLFGGENKPATTVINEGELANHRSKIMQRVDVILDGLSGMGIRGEILGSAALNDLFYSVYNPQ